MSKLSPNPVANRLEPLTLVLLNNYFASLFFRTASLLFYLIRIFLFRITIGDLIITLGTHQGSNHVFRNMEATPVIVLMVAL